MSTEDPSADQSPQAVSPNKVKQPSMHPSSRDPSSIPPGSLPPNTAPPEHGFIHRFPADAYPNTGVFTLLTVFAFLGALMVGLVFYGIRGQPQDAPIPPLWMGLEALLGSLIWIPVALLAARHRGLSLSQATAWTLPESSLLKLLLLAGAAGLFMLTPAVWLQQLSTYIMPKLGTNLIQQLEEQNPSLAALGLIALSVVVVAPVAEEVFFRGFAFRGISARRGFWPAAIIVSAVFAVIHIEPTNMAPIFVLSLLLCWLQWKTSSVVPPILCHMVYNGVQIVGWLTSRDNPDFNLSSAAEKETIPFAAVVVSAVLLAAVIYGVREVTTPKDAPKPPNLLKPDL